MPKYARPFLESLETRLVPSTTLSIGGLQVFNYTAPGGAQVRVVATGSAGQATFSTDLSQINITGASANFDLVFSTSSSGVVPLGTINASGQKILGVQTYGPADFQLASYTGADFSTGGGLSVGDILGNVALQNLSQGTAVITTGAISGSIYIAGSLEGQINSGGFWSGNLTVGGTVAASGRIVAANQFTGTLEVGGDFSGSAVIGARAYGEWTIVGSIQAGAELHAGQDFNDLDVTGDVSGTVTAGTSIWTNVGGNVEPAGVISSPGATTTIVGGYLFGHESGNDLFAQVAENVEPSAVLDASQWIVVNYGGSIWPGAVLDAPAVSKTYLPAVESGTAIKGLPYVISQPGTYRLTQDLVYGGDSGEAIIINADNVTLDLSGFSVIGSAGSTTLAVGIYAYNRTGVTIENGTVSGFMYGIRAEVGQYTVTNIRAVGNLYVGMSVIGEGSVVTNNTVLNTGGENNSSVYTIPIAMQVEGNDITVANNIISGFVLTPFTVEVVGIHTDQEPLATILDNFISMAGPVFGGGWAIWVNTLDTEPISNPSITGNVVVNFEYGIGFAQTSGSYQQNVFMNVPVGILSWPGVTDGGGNIFS